ncbi:molybdate ABC transporter substrate-binding protein [Desulfurobacterium sp.]
MRLAVSILFIVFTTLQALASDIIVFAGAGMRGPLDAIGEIFEKLYGVRVVYDYEGSGRLGNKILAGQIPDIFIPGSMRWANVLKKKNLIAYCFPIAYHIPVVVVPKGDSRVNGFYDISNKNVKVVVGDPKACAIGKVTQKIFSKAGLKERNLNIVAYGVTVKQVLHWVENRNADAGIVWRSDAVSSPSVQLFPIPEQFNIKSIIPVCVIKYSKEKEVVKSYVKFLKMQGFKIFEDFGFLSYSRGGR